MTRRTRKTAITWKPATPSTVLTSSSGVLLHPSLLPATVRFAEATATLAGIGTGDFVSWKASRGEARGKVVSTHTSSKVPGVLHEMIGSTESPAARVRLYAKSGNGWVPTETHVPMRVSQLSKIDALPEPAVESVAGSFDDIRGMVQDAICDRAEMFGAEDPEIWVSDIGLDWVVYSVGWDGDLWMSSYAIDGSGAVVLGDPSEVVKVTMYVPEQEPVDGPTGAPLDGEATADDTAQMGEARADRIEGRLLGAMGTDANGGRVFSVRIIAYGDSKNGRRYSEATMRAAVARYEGAKAYDHHRSDTELATSTVAGLVGTYRNVRATTDGLEAELHLLPGATHVAEALDMSLANQQRGLPPLVGISHDVMARYRPITVTGGRKLMEATEIVSVNSADVVADPAAGGQATRMVAGGIGTDTPTTPEKENTLNLQQLLALLRSAESARRAELLTVHAHVIESAGLTTDEVLRLVGPAPTAASAPAAIAEAVHAKSSVLGRQVVRGLVAEARLPESAADAVLAALDERFTESKAAQVIAALQPVVTGAPVAPIAPVAASEAVLADKAELGGKIHAAPNGTHNDDVEKIREGVYKMLCGDYSTFRSLKGAYRAVSGHRGDPFTEDFNRMMMAESAQLSREGRMVDFDSNFRSLESVSSSTWGFILGDSITRRMLDLYNLPNLQTWRAVVSSIVPINDFRTQRLERVGGYGTLPTVAQGTAYQPLTSPGNEEITYSLTKRGGTEDLTLETIANDDMRVVQRIPQVLGRAAGETLYRFAWDLLSPTTNANIYDSTALYAAGHNNTFGNALSSTALETARKALRKQSAYGDTSQILSLVPKVLAVPSDLEPIALLLATSPNALPSGAPVGAATNIPNIHQGITPIVVDHWSAQSATGWVVAADPTQVPTIELGFYQGQQDPALFVQNDPTVGSLYNADKITWKIRHIYSGAVLDFRGLVRGNS